MGMSHSSGKRKQRERVSVFNPPSCFPPLVLWLVLGLPGEQICAILTLQSGGENCCFGGQAPEMLENHRDFFAISRTVSAGDTL